MGKNLWTAASKFSDLVTSKSISISENNGKLVASEKYSVALATPVVSATSPIRKWIQSETNVPLISSICWLNSI